MDENFEIDFFSETYIMKERKNWKKEWEMKRKKLIGGSSWNEMKDTLYINFWNECIMAIVEMENNYFLVFRVEMLK